MSSEYNPKHKMWVGYLFPLTLAWLLTFEVSWINALIAGLVWVCIVVFSLSIPLFLSIIRNGIPDSVMTSKNKAIARQIPLYMYVIGFLCSSILYGTLYQYYPVTAVIGWLLHIVFVAVFTTLMDKVRDAMKLKE